MKKLFLFILLILSINSYSQLELGDVFLIDCLKETFKLDYAISLANHRGDLKRAKKFINDSKNINNEIEKIFLNAFLTHNVYGNLESQKIITEAEITDEEKDLIKLQLLFYTSNKLFDNDYKKFIAKYPKNYIALKLKYKSYLKSDYESLLKNTPNTIKEIDSLLDNKLLKKNDEIYFNILKLDFFNKKLLFLKNNTIDKNEIIKRLLMIFNENKDYFELNYLKSIIIKKGSNNKVCKEVLEYIERQNILNPNTSSTHKIYNLLFKKSKEFSDISNKEMEYLITKLIKEEKDEQEINNSKALISFFTLTEIKKIKISLNTSLQPLTYSDAINQLLAEKKSTKEILDNISLLLNDPEINDFIKDDEYVSHFYENKENFTTGKISGEELQQIYGLLVYSIYFKKNTYDDFLYDFNQVNLHKKKYSNDVNDYLLFLDSNPLYLKESSYPDCYIIDSEFDLFDFIRRFNELNEKYKGSIAILKFTQGVLIDAKEYIKEEDKQLFYLTNYKLLVDLFSINYHFSFDLKYYEPSIQFGKLFDMSYNKALKHFYNLLTEENKIFIINYTAKKLKENPSKKELIELNDAIQLISKNEENK